ncbi:MAG: autotransporter outer membrane beta-barrel domain-containing protein [Elusimicrobiota bacterium]|nr:autotransporter outer membrane beta-barrel domain-containing protein [Elusimicrobiota bacterium]
MSILNYQGTFNINQGSVQSLSNMTEIDTLNINGSGLYELSKNNKTIVNDININGILQIDLDTENNLNSNETKITVGGQAHINQLTSRLLINGSAFWGKISLTFLEGSANSISGQWYNNAISGSEKMIFDPVYTPDGKYVKLTITGLSMSQLSGLNDNQKQVANLFDKTPVGGVLDNIIIPLANMSDSQAKQKLEILSGSFYANILNYEAISNNLNDIIFRIDLNTIEATGEDKKEMWINAGIKGLNFNSNDDLSESINSSGFGGQIGADIFNNGDDFIGGIYGGFEKTDFKQAENTANINDITLGIYGAFIHNKYKLSGVLSFGLQTFNSERDLSFINSKSKADFNTQSIRLGAEYKYITPLNENINLIPFIDLLGGFLMTPDIEEKGNSNANLTIKANNYTRLSALIGAGLENQEGFFRWDFRAYLGYLFIGAGKQEYEISFSSAKEYEAMSIYSSEIPNINFGFSGGIDLVFSDYLSIFFKGSTQLDSNIMQYTGSIGVNYKL